MYGYDQEHIRRATPIYGGLRGARYLDPEEEGYRPLSPTHPLARRLRAIGFPLAPGSGPQPRRYGSGYFAGVPEHRPRRAAYDVRDFVPRGRAGYDAAFRPLRPNDPLGRALRDEAEYLVTDYLRGERYGDEYARDLGLRVRGGGNPLRAAARRISGRGYERGG